MKKYIKLIPILIIFMLFSIINIKSVDDSFLSRQITWFFLSFILMLVIIKIPTKYLIKFTFFLYIFLNLCLLYLLIFGDTINGSRAWINLGFMSFQPSEFMKIVLIIILSIISLKEHYILKSIIITIIPSILTFLEPDTGNVIFFFIILLSVLFYRIKNIKYIIRVLLICLIFIVGFICLYFFKQELFISLFGSSFFYRMDRLVYFFNSNSYQLNNALISIGTSGLYGSTNELVYIPEAMTDFAFALLISNIGLVGSFIYITLNMIFDFTLINSIKKSNLMLKSIIFSFLCLKITQSAIHMLMNVGLFPITGITLPFISYGGSSLISYFILLAIIFRIHKDSNLD